MDKAQWLNSATHNASAEGISETAKIPRATVFRRKRDMSFTAEEVIAIARAYHANPLTGLVAFGYLTEQEAGMPVDVEQSALEAASAKNLLEELTRRLGYR
ncbi:hypothetical protein [Bifidobacterium pseudolongum]|uniref:hypothetical protein n=1 Tax=Bifidobacterium pseudolongum TaxID=1694 RepID=UPI001020BD29|nr:hypothetical protein [Bifidobacterium pseudolongum]RYQ41935.1 hypothetical protein PG1791B_1712 [Bifidobacterium pseudolongum subsp. globosum]